MIVPVILCGGGGTRLWPRSRLSRPKPFLPLVGERTLFTEALDRVTDSDRFGAPVIVTGAAHVDLVEAELGTREASIIVEPVARNTAAAIALAALRLPAETAMLVCPSDHHIAHAEAFRTAALTGAALAQEGWLVAFGIRPMHPETGYGYIRRGQALRPGAFRVERFIEKPDPERAESFLKHGGYDWNGGIFAFRASDFLRQLKKHRRDIFDAIEIAVAKGRVEGKLFHPDAASFADVPGESIDYAVMEKTDRAAVVPVDMGWSDIGNWQALRDARAADERGNRVEGAADLIDCNNVLVETDGPRVSAIGLSDVCIVVNGDEVLVTSADGAQKVGRLPGARDQSRPG